MDCFFMYFTEFFLDGLELPTGEVNHILLKAIHYILDPTWNPVLTYGPKV